jgi:hypothetical protein
MLLFMSGFVLGGLIGGAVSAWLLYRALCWYARQPPTPEEIAERMRTLSELRAEMLRR